MMFSSLLKEYGRVEKDILQKYSDAKARIRHLRGAVDKLNQKIEKLEHTEYGLVGDTVTRGKRGKNPLGTVKISGFPVPEYREAEYQLKLRRQILEQQEMNLLLLINEVEAFIDSITDIELQNILTLYYIENLTWMQVARRMNELYQKEKYTENSCRCKHDRYIQNSK